ncbi:Retrovirus-related Pol polyprotein from transposon TNT 1-94 [Senna tora]|uniref:Retrovirus-related Pol polyprotein from transposon TNT 1-94 n=1 Tax=Senna tora TaxID=362788 RepID=A0A834WJ92_9FABA|nr:Retrovirus-related Pol polyprotein from transposon TNT 1-94 [Senna tora]
MPVAGLSAAINGTPVLNGTNFKIWKERVSYNTQKENRSLNELIVQCVQEEERHKQNKVESAHLASSSGAKASKKKKMNDKGTANNGEFSKNVQKKQDAGPTCFFCRKHGHVKKDCPKFADWRVKKGMLLNFVCSEVNLDVVPIDTWWLDSGSTAHISVSMQGCLRSRMSNDDERYIYIGNDNRIAIKVIRDFRIHVYNGLYLDLEDTFVVPSFKCNLISISCLDNSGYICSFENGLLSISLNSNIVAKGTLVDKLYKLDTNCTDSNVNLHSINYGTKRKLTDENSLMLWHKRLGYISKQRMQRLMSDGILDTLDLSNFDVCIQCIKGKQTNVRKTSAKRSNDHLELIHTYVCGPFPTAAWNVQTYFVNFIDDYSRYGYLYLIHEKSQVLDVFKFFKAEVEYYGRSDRGGEYYSKYDGSSE